MFKFTDFSTPLNKVNRTLNNFTIIFLITTSIKNRIIFNKITAFTIQILATNITVSNNQILIQLITKTMVMFLVTAIIQIKFKNVYKISHYLSISMIIKMKIQHGRFQMIIEIIIQYLIIQINTMKIYTRALTKKEKHLNFLNKIMK